MGKIREFAAVSLGLIIGILLGRKQTQIDRANARKVAEDYLRGKAGEQDDHSDKKMAGSQR